jgi:apolipoprotein N-acyltransferase
VLKATVRGYTGATPYARWGNYPVVIAAFVLLAVKWLAARAAAGRRRG